MSLVLMASCVAAAPDGEALYKKRCAPCHDGAPQARMPSREEVGKRSPEEVFKTMFAGAMQPQSAGITPEEGRAIALYLTGKEFGKAAAPMSGMCPGGAKPFQMDGASWNGWSPDTANTRYQAHAGLTAEQTPKLKLKWAFGFPETSVAFAQPTVVGGRVFVGSGSGKVYSLDAATGCTYWSFEAGMPVRTAVSVGSLVGGKFAAYFGDLSAVVYAVDASTGKLLWKTRVEDHLIARVTGSPVLFSGRLYVPVSSVEEASAQAADYECCKFRGSIVSLDAATGKQVWKSYSVTDPARPTKKTAAGVQRYGPAGAAIWCAPTIDAKRKLVYAATGNSYTDVDINTSNAILAIDMESGRLKWASQVLAKDNFVMGCRPGKDGCPAPMGPDLDFGSSTILRTMANGKQILLAGQKSSILYGLDPDQQGKILWQIKLGQGGALGGIEWGFAADPTFAYAAVSDRFRGETSGGLHAVRLENGEKLWSV
ncbi:MAG TPA: PQQ-binding-like beta-propeller repeat protein, partial [Bryobacteraceae bacterium]|nr:PQQ-binding-like beta-propeller repeat protein [Bryobacteraceae bacterium]